MPPTDLADSTKPKPKLSKAKTDSHDSVDGPLTMPSSQGWPAIIAAVKSPLGFFTLLLLVVGAILGTVGIGMTDRYVQLILAGGSIVIILAVILVVAINFRLLLAPGAGPALSSAAANSGLSLGTMLQPQVATAGDDSQAASDDSSSSLTESQAEVAARVKQQGGDVLFYRENRRSKLDVWQQDMRPYLHQAAHYSIPTYFLDMNLNVVDWNIAFDVVFNELTSTLRGKHVNWFIARMANFNDVFDHAKAFTREVIENKALPYVDLEPIDYFSPEYRLVRTVKVATQLTDSHGEGRGWSVALIPKQIDWEKFEPRLKQRIHDDKMWSVYSASYDRVLRRFPPYLQLIEDVMAVVTDPNQAVLDLGCGTGNVTASLVKKGHRVTAIEDNLGMLDRFAAKDFSSEQVKLIKASVEHLDFLADKTYDAAVMVNVLYALGNPTACLRSIHRVLRDGGVLGLSTTHRETDLTPLLRGIKAELVKIGKFEKLAADYAAVEKVNRQLETSIVRRHTREQVKDMVRLAGFDIIREVPAAYEGAVMILHARKRDESSDSAEPKDYSSRG